MKLRPLSATEAAMADTGTVLDIGSIPCSWTSCINRAAVRPERENWAARRQRRLRRSPAKPASVIDMMAPGRRLAIGAGMRIHHRCARGNRCSRRLAGRCCQLLGADGSRRRRQTLGGGSSVGVRRVARGVSGTARRSPTPGPSSGPGSLPTSNIEVNVSNHTCPRRGKLLVIVGRIRIPIEPFRFLSQCRRLLAESSLPGSVQSQTARRLSTGPSGLYYWPPRPALRLMRGFAVSFARASAMVRRTTCRPFCTSAVIASASSRLAAERSAGAVRGLEERATAL